MLHRAGDLSKKKNDSRGTGLCCCARQRSEELPSEFPVNQRWLAPGPIWDLTGSHPRCSNNAVLDRLGAVHLVEL